jgi:hypothetical protein
MADHDLDAEVAALRRVQKRVLSVAHRMTWRIAGQRWRSRIGTVVRLLPSIVIAPSFTRTKGPTGWLVQMAEGEDSGVILEIVTRSALRTVEQLNEPVAVRVLRHDKVVTARLLELASSGSITIVWPEAAT